MIADLVKSLKDTHVKQIEINDQIGKKREKISFLNTHVTLEHQKKADNNLDNARLKYQYNMGDTNSAIKELYSIGERKGDFTKEVSTFFPDNWSQKKIQKEIAYGLSNKVQESGDYYIGKMSNGTKIGLWIKKGKLDSAYPIIGKGK